VGLYFSNRRRSHTISIEVAMTITIRVPWQNPYDHGDKWNELLAWTVETYGLPGERVNFHPTADFMDFTFDDEKDALMFQVKTGGFRREEADIVVDFVGRMMHGGV
jgi:hypothetical protein